MGYNGDVWGIVATRYTYRYASGLERPEELCLRTRCPAIAKYVVFEHERVKIWPIRQIEPLNPASTE